MVNEEIAKQIHIKYIGTDLFNSLYPSVNVGQSGEIGITRRLLFEKYHMGHNFVKI